VLTEGRARGERHGSAKLTEAAVREIRALVASGCRRCVVAARFGVSVRTVSFIVTRDTWGWVEDAPADVRGLTEREVARFWSKVDVRGPTDCWPWTAGQTRDGYGRFRREGGSPVCQPAHRVAWEARHGPIPEGLGVCHSCYNRPCVNPLHLYLATTAERNADLAFEGRFRRGQGCWQAKLKEEQVLDIRRRAAAGDSAAALGRAFGVASATVRKVVCRRNWAWLEGGD